MYDENSKILILGSFPSVSSRKEMFFYGHPQNRFWRVVSEILLCKTPTNTDEKKNMLLSNGIAVWDVIASCEIEGSADSSIAEETPNDLTPVLQAADIKAIFTNGKKAHNLYEKMIYPNTEIHSIYLPSTSPANAAFSVEKLVSEWRIINNYL